VNSIDAVFDTRDKHQIIYLFTYFVWNTDILIVKVIYYRPITTVQNVKYHHNFHTSTILYKFLYCVEYVRRISWEFNKEIKV